MRQEHDPLCPTHRSNSTWLTPVRECDYCKVIAKVREDETRKRVALEEEAGYLRATAEQRYNKGYTAGYNDHARSRAYMEQVYGPYPENQPGIIDNGDGTVTLRVQEYGIALPHHYFKEWLTEETP